MCVRLLDFSEMEKLALELHGGDLVPIYKVKKLFDDFDTESGISADEYADMVEDVISYDLRIETIEMAKSNLEIIDDLLSAPQFIGKRKKKQLRFLKDTIHNQLAREENENYLQNMRDSLLSRMSKYRKSKCDNLLTDLDARFADWLFAWFSDGMSGG